VERGELQPDSVYVVQPARLAAFLSHPEAAMCGVLDGHAVCVSTARETAFRQVLARQPIRAP
jgi:hypothetical protein